MRVDPSASSAAAHAAGGDRHPRRRLRDFAFLLRADRAEAPPRAGAGRTAPAPADPAGPGLSCWHVWVADGLVGAPADGPVAYADLFARAEAAAAARTAAYRANDAPGAAGPAARFDARA